MVIVGHTMEIDFIDAVLHMRTMSSRKKILYIYIYIHICVCVCLCVCVFVF